MKKFTIKQINKPIFYPSNDIFKVSYQFSLHSIITNNITFNDNLITIVNEFSSTSKSNFNSSKSLSNQDISISSNQQLSLSNQNVSISSNQQLPLSNQDISISSNQQLPLSNQNIQEQELNKLLIQAEKLIKPSLRISNIREFLNILSKRLNLVSTLKSKVKP